MPGRAPFAEVVGAAMQADRVGAKLQNGRVVTAPGLPAQAPGRRAAVTQGSADLYDTTPEAPGAA